jgi:hypothetical protein
MNGMDEQQRRINERMANPSPLVSEEEVRAAEGVLQRLSDAAGRNQPIPAIFIRFMLEEAAKVRVASQSQS